MVAGFAPDNNFGGRSSFDVGYTYSHLSYTLLRFDLSALRDRYSKITAATLRLRVAPAPIRAAGIVEVFRLADANSSWQEGQFETGRSPASGVPARGDSTWKEKNPGSAKWAGAGGAGKIGVDTGEHPLASRSYTRPARRKFDLRLEGDLTFIENWINGGVNAGLLLSNPVFTEGNRIKFHSAEAKQIPLRPMLIVEYVPKIVNDKTAEKQTGETQE